MLSEFHDIHFTICRNQQNILPPRVFNPAHWTPCLCNSTSPILKTNPYFAFPINSAPFLTTPTTAPVWTTSPPPPLSLYSTSANPSNHVISTFAGTSNFVNSSLNEVMISANANPCVALSEFIICKQDVTSGVLRSVFMIRLISSGCGDAMHS